VRVIRGGQCPALSRASKRFTDLHRRFLLCIAVLASLSTAPRLCAQKQVTAVESLAGVRSAYVFVYAGVAAIQAGVDTSALRVSIELALRRLGIRVLSREEYTAQSDPRSAARTGRIELLLSAITSPPEHITTHVELSVRQYATLLRDRNAVVYATTWSADEQGAIPNEVYVERTESAVAKLVEKLSNDFLAANPVHQ
jgi:hypothetical protein